MKKANTALVFHPEKRGFVFQARGERHAKTIRSVDHLFEFDHRISAPVTSI